MASRIHEDMGGGYVKQTKFMLSKCGKNKFEYPITNPGLIPISQVAGKYPIMNNSKSPSKSCNMSNMPNNITMMTGGPIEETELPYGQIMTVREETPAITKTRRLLQVTIQNAEVTDEVIMLFDGHNFATTKLGIVNPPKGGVTVGGTFAANTYAWLKSVTLSNPYRVAGIQFQGFTNAGAKSDAFFVNGSYQTTNADEGYQTVQQIELPLSDLVFQDSFNTNIRNDRSYRAVFDGFMGARVALPTGQKIIINYTLISVARSYGMKRIGVNTGC